MNVPFLSSSALSRSQYALVRKVENAISLQAVDEILFAEIDSIRGRLRKSSLVRLARALIRFLFSHITERMQRMPCNTTLLCHELYSYQFRSGSELRVVLRY